MCIAEIHWQVWLAILAIVFGNTVRVILVNEDHMSSMVYLDDFVLWFVLLYVVWIWRSVISVVDHLCTPKIEDNSIVLDNNGFHIFERYEQLCKEVEEFEEKHGEEEEEEVADLEEIRKEEFEKIMAGGLCGHANPQQKLFFLNTASSVIKGLQLAILCTAIAIPLYLITLVEQVTTEDHWVRFLINALIAVPPLVLVFVCVPAIIPRYVLITSVAGMSRPIEVRSTVDKMRREDHKRLKEKMSEGKPKKKRGCCGGEKKKHEGRREERGSRRGEEDHRPLVNEELNEEEHEEKHEGNSRAQTEAV